MVLATLMETGILTLTRASLFFASRKYLLRILYSDLQTLSVSATPDSSTPAQHPDGPQTPIELDSLPLPSTHTPKSPKFFSPDASYLHATVSRSLFSWCFAESCMMFILLILQGLGMLSPSSRLLNWRFSLYFLMAAVLVFIPLCFSLILSIRSSDARSLRGFRAILSLIPVAGYLFGLSLIPLPVGLESSGLAQASLSRLIVLGTIILGLLSGFGAVSNSWRFLPFVNYQQSVPTEQDIDTAQYALTSIKNDIDKRRAEAARREGANVEGSWFSRVGSSFRGGDDLTQELQGLEALEYQMSRNVEALRERREAALFDGTCKGILFKLAGRMFATYCVFRVISSLYNIIFLSTRRSPGTTYPDLITKILAYTLSHFSVRREISHEDIAAVATQISLVFVGLVILSSIRLVLRGATRALRITSRNLAASLMLLVLAQIMAIYLLSTIVQMRSSFPPPPSTSTSTSTLTMSGDAEPTKNLFSTIPEYEVFGSLFDGSFLIAVCGSVFVRWGAERVNGVGD